MLASSARDDVAAHANEPSLTSQDALRKMAFHLQQGCKDASARKKKDAIRFKKPDRPFLGRVALSN